MPMKRLLGAAAVCANAVAAGIIDSSNGKANVTPAPRFQLGGIRMYISKRNIRRRAFLRGAGVTLALPLLESMIPAATALAQTAAAPKSRFMGIFFPHGM